MSSCCRTLSLCLAAFMLISQPIAPGRPLLIAATNNSSPPTISQARPLKFAGDDERVKAAWNDLNEFKCDRAIASLSGPLIEAMADGSASSRAAAARYLLLMSHAFRADENERAALDCCKLAVALEPDDLLAKTFMIDSLTRSCQFDRAKKLLDQLAAGKGSNRLVARSLGFYYSHSLNDLEALVNFRTAARLDDEDPRLHYGMVHCLRSKEAGRQYVLAAKYTTSPYMRELFLYQAGRIGHPQAEDWAHLMSASKILPDDPVWRVELGLARYRKGQVEQGFQEFIQAVQCPRLSSRAFEQFATYAMFHNQGSEAERALAWLEKYQPGNPEVAWLRGYLHQTKGEVGEAERQFSLALSLNPRFTQGYQCLSELASYKNNRQKSLQLASEWTKNLPVQPEGFLYLGNLMRKDNRYADALPAYRKAGELEERFEVKCDLSRLIDMLKIRAGLGMCAYKTGDRPAAIKEAIEFNRRKPNPEDAGGPVVRLAKLDWNKPPADSKFYKAACCAALADLLYECEDLDDCVSEYKKAIAIEDRPDWHRGLFKAYMDNHNWSEAVREDFVVSNNMVTKDFPKAVDDLRKKYLSRP